MAYAPYIVVSCETGTILLDKDTFEVTAPPPTSQLEAAATRSCAVNPSGSVLAIGYTSGHVRFFDPETFVRLDTLNNGSSQPVNDVAWHPNGSLIAVSYGGNQGCLIYNYPALTLAQNLGGFGLGLGCAFSPNGQYFAWSDANSTYLRVFNTSDWSQVTIASGVPGAAYEVEFSPDSQHLAVSHATSPFLTVYNTSTWTKVTLTGGNPPSTGFSVAFSRAGHRLVVGSATTSPFMALYDTTTWARITVTDSGLSSSIHYGAAFDPTDTNYFFGRFDTPHALRRSVATNARTNITGISSTARAFTFLPVRLVPESFSTTQFGTPVSVGISQSGQASGWSSLEFGEAVAIPDQVCAATSISPSLTFGSALGATRFRHLGEAHSRFGTPNTPTLQVGGAIGFRRTQFDVPYGYNVPTPPLSNLVVKSSGFRVSAFGLALAAATRTAAQTGSSTTGFGVAKSAGQYATTGSELSSFGTAMAAQGGRVAAFVGTVFGTASTSSGRPTTGRSTTRFGRPSSYLRRLGSFGWMTSRLGTPRCRVLVDARKAESFTATDFGQAGAFSALKTVQLAPTTSFGRATVRRSPA